MVGEISHVDFDHFLGRSPAILADPSFSGHVCLTLSIRHVSRDQALEVHPELTDLH